MWRTTPVFRQEQLGAGTRDLGSRLRVLTFGKRSAPCPARRTPEAAASPSVLPFKVLTGL